MEYTKDADTPHVIAIPWTPTKPRQSLKFYVRRKSTKLLNKAQDIDGSIIFLQDINDSTLLKSNLNTSKEEFEEKCFFPGDCGFVITKKTEESETLQGKSFNLVQTSQNPIIHCSLFHMYYESYLSF